LTELKDYFFGNLDPYRFIIQVDVDVPLVPDAGNVTLRTMAHQEPAAKCLTANEDMEAFVSSYWTWRLPDIPESCLSQTGLIQNGRATTMDKNGRKLLDRTSIVPVQHLLIF
jgi:hypothetical protein